jgi:hypothetical protein
LRRQVHMDRISSQITYSRESDFKSLHTRLKLSYQAGLRHEQALDDQPIAHHHSLSVVAPPE